MLESRERSGVTEGEEKLLEPVLLLWLIEQEEIKTAEGFLSCCAEKLWNYKCPEKIPERLY